MFKIVGSIFSWLIGGLLFVFISLKIFVSYLVTACQAILRIKVAKPFREKDYTSLPPLPTNQVERIIFSAKFPSIQKQVEEYDLGAVLDPQAKEVLISAQLNSNAEEQVECSYSLYAGGSETESVDFFLFGCPFKDSMALDYSRCQFWYALPPQRKFCVQLIDSYLLQPKVELPGKLNIVGCR